MPLASRPSPLAIGAESFLVEIQTTAGLQHPQVLRVEDIVAGPYRGVEPHPDGTSFLAMKRPRVDPEDILRGDDRRLVFVVNWIREMRARLER